MILSNATSKFRPSSPRKPACTALLSGPWIALFLALGLGVPLAGWADSIIRVGEIPFQVEIARTAAERQQGLMFRTQLPDKHGMLFIQPQAAPAAFWMKNTYIPLDLLYFDEEGRLVQLFSEVPPCTTPDCPVYASQAPVKYILEISGGSAERLGLRTGARLHLD